jgi:glycosyltransferase involved in cell wall biosynthesis
VQDLWPESLSATGYIRNRFIIAAVRQIVRFIYSRADLLLVQSMAFVVPVRALASNTPIIYYPNSVDDAFSVLAKSEPPVISGLDNGFSVVFAGNIGAAQAVDVIVEAASILKEYSDIHFVVLGDGSCRVQMLDAARQRGLSNLHLPGRFPIETMPGFMQKASVLLVTLADRPIFAATVPNKVQAYLASGRPIIACLNGEGARLVGEAEAGLATPAEDAQSLADSILRLYNLSPGEREIMGENGRLYYQKHFDHQHLVDELVEHLQAVSQGRKGIQ